MSYQAKGVKQHVVGLNPALGDVDLGCIVGLFDLIFNKFGYVKGHGGQSYWSHICQDSPRGRYGFGRFPEIKEHIRISVGLSMELLDPL